MTRARPSASIGRKLTRMNMLVSGAALLLACGTFVGYDALTFRDAMARNLTAQAQMVATNSVAPLVFGDRAAAEATLAALRAVPGIVSAHVYAPDGTVFANYWREGTLPPPAPLPLPAARGEIAFDTGSVSMVQPIVLDGKPIGNVYIRQDLQAVYQRLLRYAFLVGIVFMASLLTALMVSRVVRRGMSGPLVQVAAVAQRVAEQNDYSLRAAAGPGSSRELASLVASFNEMLTRIQQRDRELEASRAELDERVRLRTAELKATNEELEAFSYSVSHDLRAPLRHITGFASMLKHNAADALDAKGHHYLQTMIDAAARMGRLIDDLLTFSRMGRAALSPRPVDLGELVRDARAEVATEVNGRAIRWDVQLLPPVVADPALMRPALVNLLSNAVKYTGTRDEARIEIGTAPSPDAGEVVVFIRDNGVGFDMQYADKLFGVFQRLHRAEEFSGTGIGLANVRRIIQRHGGRTWAEGEVGRGATFYFSLPAGALDGGGTQTYPAR